MSQKTITPSARGFGLKPGLRQGWLTGLLALVASLLYANTFGNGYVLDDVAVITGNKIVTGGVSAIPEIFRTPYLHGFINNPNDLYRPLPLAMFALEWTLSDGAPMLGHVVNVLLFCCCCVLLFFFLDELFQKKRQLLAWIAALLFALHPVHTEVVANIKSRDELLCFFFAFSSLMLLLRYARGGRVFLLISGVALYFLSLLSKETSISFLLAIPAVLFLFEKDSGKRNLIITGSIAISIALFLAIRFSVLHAYDANHPFQVAITENALAGASGGASRIATAVLILGMYLKLLIIPYPLVSDYSFNSIPLTSFRDAWVWLSLLLYVAIAVVGVRRLAKNRCDVYGFGMLFYLATLALFSNIGFLVGATMAERFLFFPSVGFCLVAAGLLTSWVGNEVPFPANKKLLYTLIPIAIVCAAIVIPRNAVWKDSTSLYKHDIEYAGANYRLPYYLGSELINSSNEEADSAGRRMLLEEAIVNLKKSVDVYPRFPIPYSQLGISYTNLGQYDSAVRYELQALALNPRDTFSRNNLAAAYFKTGRYRDAITQCRINLDIDPAYARSWSNIGVCYLKLGVPDSAIPALHKVLELQPGNNSACYFLSVAFTQMGLTDSAGKYEALAKSGGGQ